MKHLRALATGLVLVTALAPWFARAAEKFPSRPVTIVVPYAAGGSNDLFARFLAKHLADSLRQPVLVENRTGASGNIASAFVSKAAADGHTLVLASSSLTTNAAVQPKSAVDPVKGLTPIAIVAKGPFILVANKDFPVRTPVELVAELKRNPGKYSYASAGPGSTNHFATELLKAMSGTQLLHVAYRGATPAMNDLMGGQVQLTLSTVPSLLPYVRANRVTAIGITSAKSSAVAPELLPLASAVPGYEFEQWWGVLAPAGTPVEIASRLNAEVNRIIATREFQDFVLTQGAIAQSATPAEFAAIIAAEIPRWQKIAKDQNLQQE